MSVINNFRRPAPLGREDLGDEAPRDEGPKLAEGVELIGEYEGSGFKEAPSLVRRPDGQVIQLPPLLYSVASKADGARSYEELAAAASAEINRGLDAEQIRFLVEEKLRPIGVLAAADGTSPHNEKPDPFLGLKFRAAVIPERTSDTLGGIFRPLFLPPLVVAVLAVFIWADGWLFFHHGVAQSLRQSIEHPAIFLLLFAAIVVSAAFHEIGHAAACRYGGGHPGKMGCGLYLAWPAFYTDVTDAYRLGRRARLRTDLGGVYFNVVIVLITVGAYQLTRFEPLLILVVIQHFEIAHQLLPVIRLDGYYIIADLTGVPDLFARIGPILSSLIPGRKTDERVRVLKRWVRVAVTAWVLLVVPLLIFELLTVLIHLPRILGTAWHTAVGLAHSISHDFSGGNIVMGIVDVIEIVVLAIPIVGILLMLAKVAISLTRGLWSHTKGEPVRRSVGFAALTGGAVLLALAWLPGHNYKPIQPGERGTITEAAAATRRLPSGDAPLYSERQAEHRATTSPSAPASTNPGSGAPSTEPGTTQATTNTASTNTQPSTEPVSTEPSPAVQPAPTPSSSVTTVSSPKTQPATTSTTPPTTTTLPPADTAPGTTLP
jgi:putative peptide zinc metalloprotease protein